MTPDGQHSESINIEHPICIGLSCKSSLLCTYSLSPCLNLIMSLPLRALGRDGPQVTAVGLGFGSLGGFYGPAGTLDEKVALLEHAHATGLRFWDMADIYADSEDIVGEWFKRSAKRDDIFLATKFGLLHQPDGKYTFRTDPKYMKIACEKSLQRLRVDAIDIYYCHQVDGVTPIEKTVEAMMELKE